jgi:hypothetical protein
MTGGAAGTVFSSGDIGPYVSGSEQVLTLTVGGLYNATPRTFSLGSIDHGTYGYRPRLAIETCSSGTTTTTTEATTTTTEATTSTTSSTTTTTTEAPTTTTTEAPTTTTTSTTTTTVPGPVGSWQSSVWAEFVGPLWVVLHLILWTLGFLVGR